MSPSERISYIRDIAASLRSEDWPIIDLTLKQFSLPWSDTYQGDRDAYVIDMIESASDSVLLELAKHLGLASQIESIAAPSFWAADDARVFISHVSSIKEKAAFTSQALSEFGLTCFVAHEDIEPTREWQNEIELALASMDALVALLSPGFNESQWCDQEVGVAVGRRVPIVPVKIDLDPYGLFGKYQAIPAKGKNPTEVAPKIFESLIEKPQIGAKITTQLVAKLRGSRSWDESRRLMARIEISPYITRSHISSMQAAIEENGEVTHAFTVPEKIAELAAKHKP